jgi:hypothetical protein
MMEQSKKKKDLANAQQMGAAAQFAHPAGGGAQKAGGTFEPWWCQNASGGNGRSGLAVRRIRPESRENSSNSWMA